VNRSLPLDSVRGRVRGWIERHADRLGDDVLELGARMHDPRAWWVTARDLARGQWLCTDLQPGPNVDQVADAHALPAEWSDRFSGIVCSEVLEHVERPWRALPELHRVLRPGGWLVVTTLTAFPIHGYPADYWRFTEQGLHVLLEDAGFGFLQIASAGQVEFALNDHGEPGTTRLRCPMHVFAVAGKPC
jgi:SAM-dependent methyltransferase